MSSGTVAIWAMKDNDYEPTPFAGTTAGLQAAIDYLAGGKGKVFVGPGTLETTTAIWIHSYCHLQGSGRGVTIIRRASGSITDGDAANSGCVVGTSAYGANGTLSSSSAIQYDITISDITLDGNSSAFGSLSNSTPHQSGLLAASVDGLSIYGTTIQNTLRSGYMMVECKDIMLSDVEADTVGQFSVVTTRNAFDFYNYNAATAGHGINASLDNFRVYNCGDNAIVCVNMQNVSVSNGSLDTLDHVFEILGSANTEDKNIQVSNISATGVRSSAVLIGSGAVTGRTISNIHIANWSCVFGSSHTGLVISLETGSGDRDLYGVTIRDCMFYNINQSDAASATWISMASNIGDIYRDFLISGCSFYGQSTSTRTDSRALHLGGKNTQNFRMENCYFQDVPGRGPATSDVASAAIRSVVFDGVIVNGANSIGFQSAGSFNGATVSEIYFINCVAIDTNKQTGDSAFQIIANGAGFTLSDIYLRGCRAYKTAGSTMQYGVDLNESGGTLDRVTIENCDFRGVQTGDFKAVTGTPTNIRFTSKPGRGTDITAAATIAVPTDGSTFHVTGNTNITNGITVNAWDNGRTVTLIFEGTPTVSDTGTSKLAGNFVAAGTTNDFDTLTLVCDGTNWTEVARSTN